MLWNRIILRVMYFLSLDISKTKFGEFLLFFIYKLLISQTCQNFSGNKFKILFVREPFKNWAWSRFKIYDVAFDLMYSLHSFE